MISAALFDLDDTLYPQGSWLAGAWAAVAARGTRLGLPRPELLAALHAVAALGSDRGHIIDRALERCGSQWRTPVMPVAIGLYLPFGLSVTILLGALGRTVLGESAKEEGGAGVLFAAGLVAGEALMGVLSGALVTAGMKLPLK